MPMQIPIYEGPQVSPTGDPGAALRAPNRFLTPEAFGVPIGQAGESIGQTVFRAGMQADGMRAEQAVTQYQKAQLGLGQGDGNKEPGAFNLKGQAVMPTPNADPNSDASKPLTDRYMAKAQSDQAQIRAGLANDQQRAMFDQAAGKLNMAFQGQLRQHETAQTHVAMQGFVADGINTASQGAAQAAANGDADAIEMNRQRSIALSRQYAVLNGMDPDAAQQEATSQVGAAAVMSMMNTGDLKGAQAYMTDHPDDFTPQTSQTLQSHIGGKISVNKAFTSANQVYDAAAKTTGIPDLSDMVSTLRGQYGDDAEGFTKARAFVEERLRDQVTANKQQDDAVQGTLWKGIVSGGSLSDATGSDLFQKMDGDEQAKFVKGVQSYQKKEDPSDGSLKLEQLKNYWTLVSDPKTLQSMSDDQVFNLAGQLGPSLFKELMATKQKLNKPDKAKAEEASTGQFSFWAKQAGINTGTSASDSDKADLGSLHLDANNLLQLERQARGRDLTASEQDDVFKSLITQKVTQTKPGTLWGTNSTELPLFKSMTKDDISKVVGIFQTHGIHNPTASQIMQGYQELSKGPQ